MRAGFFGIALIMVLLLAGAHYFLGGLGEGGNSTRLVVFHAGSLTPLIDSMRQKLGEKGIIVENEPSGSIEVARKIVDLDKSADIAMFADYRLVPELLFPAGKADWVLLFASNQLVLVYTDKSRYASEITSENWLQIILRNNTRIGFSNPNMDPCGYRAVLALALASIYYNTTAPLSFLKNHANIAYTVYSNGSIVLDATELEPDSERIIVRDKSVDLVSLVESGIIDYAFEYRNVARAHGLKYVELPRRINLADPQLNDWYSRVKVRILGSGGRVTMIAAKSITYGLTIPENAMHPNAARIFVEYLLSKEGRELMREAGFTPLDKPAIIVRSGAEFPQWLRGLVG